MASGCDGMGVAATFRVDEEPDPHLFTGATEIVPEAEPAITFIELVVELPVQPEGRDHV